MADRDIQIVLDEYADFAGTAPTDVTLAATGFSGAAVWKVRVGPTHYCVRRWPGEVDAARLARLSWIHRIVSGTASAGFDRLAVPRATRTGNTWLAHAGHAWEVASWLPGEADLTIHVTPQRLAGALDALARFHLAAARVERPSEPRSSPGLQTRSRQLESLLRGEFQTWRAEVQRAAVHATPLAGALRPLALRWCELFPRVAPRVAASLAAVSRLRVPLQPCLRDIHREHVLFVGDEVSGLIDYDAMRNETVVGDIARLVESFVGGDVERWEHGIDAYKRVRHLSDDERMLLPVFDACNVLLSSANWIDWVYVQRLEFERAERVRARLTHWMERLENLAITPLFLDIR